MKAGHVPPEQYAMHIALNISRQLIKYFIYSKLESFIRSKYESRRWALEGPPPLDPSMLDNGSAALSSTQQPLLPNNPHSPSASKPSHASSNSVSGPASITTRQPQAHQLLSANYPANDKRQTTTRSTALPSVTQAPVQNPEPDNDIFSLDFHAPFVSSIGNPITSPKTEQAPKKDVKQDILSLYSSSAGTTPSAFGGVQTSTWESQAQPQSTSMLGNGGHGLWSANSGWTGTPAASIIPPAQANLWSNSGTTAPGFLKQQTQLFNTNDVWGSPGSITAPPQDLFSASNAGVVVSQKKDDVFEDLWGGFK